MDSYKVQMARLLAESRALFFEEGLKLKDGRPTPYFINFGRISGGRYIYSLGIIWTKMLFEKGWTDKFDIVIGPSYKGSALSQAICSALWHKYRIEKLFDYDRKEKKSHGEGSKKSTNFVNQTLFDGARILMVDDVISSMATKIDLKEKIETEARYMGVEIDIVGLSIAVDREQKAIESRKENISALMKFRNLTGIEVIPLVRISEIVTYLFENKFPLYVNGTLRPLSKQEKEVFDQYQIQYGVSHT